MVLDFINNYLMIYLIRFPILIIAFTMHDFLRSLISLTLGDDTAKHADRLTLDPQAHIDPFGFIVGLAFGYGWSKTVPINPYNYKYPRFYSIITLLVGPLTYASLTLICIMGYQWIPYGRLPMGVASTLQDICSHGIGITAILTIINILPFPQFDGGQILLIMLDPFIGEKKDLIVSIGIWSGLIFLITPMGSRIVHTMINMLIFALFNLII